MSEGKASTSDFEHQDYLDYISDWPELAKDAIRNAEGTGQLVDVLGTLNQSAGRISSLRRRHQVEIEDGEHGETWALKRGRQATRTYNLSGILLAFQEKWKHESVLHTLMELINENVIRISFQWTNLRKLAADYDVLLNIASNRRIETGDPNFSVGEEWSDASPSYERLD